MKQRHTSSLDIDESSTTNISLHNVNDVDDTKVDPSPLLSSSSDLTRQLSIPTSDDCGIDTTNNDVHPPTWRHPIQSTKTYFVELSHYFGWEFLSWLAINQCFVSGGVFALVSALGLPLFKELGIDAARQQLYMSYVSVGNEALYRGGK